MSFLLWVKVHLARFRQFLVRFVLNFSPCEFFLLFILVLLLEEGGFARVDRLILLLLILHELLHGLLALALLRFEHVQIAEVLRLLVLISLENFSLVPFVL